MYTCVTTVTLIITWQDEIFHVYCILLALASVCVCARLCACARARVCARAFVCRPMCVSVRVCVCVCACARARVYLPRLTYGEIHTLYDGLVGRFSLRGDSPEGLLF